MIGRAVLAEEWQPEGMCAVPSFSSLHLVGFALFVCPPNAQVQLRAIDSTCASTIASARFRQARNLMTWRARLRQLPLGGARNLRKACRAKSIVLETLRRESCQSSSGSRPDDKRAVGRHPLGIAAAGYVVTGR